MDANQENPRLTVGQRVKHYRLAAGLSGKEFAAAVGIKGPSLTEIENGESNAPASMTLLRMAAKLKLEPWFLLTGQGPAKRMPDQLDPAEVRLLLLFGKLSPAGKIEAERKVNDLLTAERPGLVAESNPYAEAPPPGVSRRPKASPAPRTEPAPPAGKRKTR